MSTGRTVKDRPDMAHILADSVTPIVEAGLANDGRNE